MCAFADQNALLQAFSDFLTAGEKSAATREKYLRDLRTFLRFQKNRPLDKTLILSYKAALLERSYAPASINAMLCAVHAYLDFIGKPECKVKKLRIQRSCYVSEEKELTKAEYFRLLQAAKKDTQLFLLLETLASTGVRVSEISYFTMESLQQGEIRIRCKNKTRTILLPGKIQKKLLDFARRGGIHDGPIFIGRRGKSLDRSCIWRAIKSLAGPAGVEGKKVFPHNFRKLFARCFYALEKDIAKLADVLGHSSINTTRIYIMTSGTEHRRFLDRLKLIV